MTQEMGRKLDERRQGGTSAPSEWLCSLLGASVPGLGSDNPMCSL